MIVLRRFAVVLMYGAYVAGAVMQWRARTIGENRTVILALFMASFAIGALLFALTRYMRWAAANDARLDEREIATRNAVYRSAYHIAAWVSVLLLVCWYVGPLISQPLTPGTNGNVLFWGYVLLMSTLPAALLAWRDRPVA